MDEKEMLLAKIAELKAALAELEKPKAKVNRASNDPRSTLYVVDYTRLTPVHNGFVAPEILNTYK